MNKITVIFLLCLSLIANSIALTLENAEKIAIKNNLELKKEELSKKMVIWEKWDAIAQYLPSFSINTTHLRLDNDTYNRANAFSGMGGSENNTQYPPDIYVDGFTDNGTSIGRTVLENPYIAMGKMFSNIPIDKTYQNSWETKFQVNQKITNGLKELIVIFQMAPSKVNMVYGIYTLTKEQIIIQTRRSYYNLIKVKESLEMFESLVESSKKIYDKTKTQFNAGQISEDILLAQEAKLLSDKAELMNMENMLNVSKEIFFDLIGKRIDNKIITDKLSKFENIAKGKLPINGSIKENTELKIANAGLGIKKALRNITLTNSLPNINASFIRTWKSDTTIAPMDSRANNTVAILLNWNFGITNLTSSKMNIYEVKKSELEVKIKERNLKTKLKIIKDMLVYKQKKTEAMLKANIAQSKSFDIMQKRFEAGFINNIDIINMSLLYKQKRIEYLDALFDFINELDNYKLLIGKFGEENEI